MGSISKPKRSRGTQGKREQGHRSGANVTQRGPAQSIARLIADEIGLSVEVKPVGSEPDPLLRIAEVETHRVHSETLRSHTDADLVRQALALPSGEIALWSAPADQAERIARHALSLLDLHVTCQENQQLLAEVDSLTSQVVHDFEELSLIRMLASGLELPQTSQETDAFILASLQPLASGVGTESLAAILVDHPEGESQATIWTGPRLVADRDLRDFVARYAKLLRLQPVVRNDLLDGHGRGLDGVTELLMVECSSSGRVHGWLVACNRIRQPEDNTPWGHLGFTSVQASLMETVAHQLAAQLSNVRLLGQKEALFTDVVRAIVDAAESRDPLTCGHAERVAQMARCLASQVGFSPSACERIYLTGLLHDVLRIAIPNTDSHPPDRFCVPPGASINTQTDAGRQIIRGLDALQGILPGVLYHHERWNGTGGPEQLVGDQIPVEARILAICDAFDTLTSDHAEQSAMSVESAVAILQAGAGDAWDPDLIQTFVDHIDQINQICQR
ncbi:HD domain-containing protein [Stieleria sp. TO1_6]|uniref:HD-GYP domain-containing protein n=1 Tax=Stieleria tagensis TaxID=2956795 RepID=UPI00209A7FAD|nr:HD domain-containing phosphohydrolase [Stieleria tagensis]MCO8122689.1 HD domain-containing protein [Stieleria tagensis]